MTYTTNDQEKAHLELVDHLYSFAAEFGLSDDWVKEKADDIEHEVDGNKGNNPNTSK